MRSHGMGKPKYSEYSEKFGQAVQKQNCSDIHQAIFKPSNKLNK